MKKQFCTASLVLGILTGALAQAPSGTRVTGKVRDENSKAVEFAAVVLLNAADSAMVKGAITDTTGAFDLPGLPAGKYLVKISAVGYRTFFGPPVTVAGAAPLQELGVQQMASEQIALQEVVVRGERPVIERSIGKVSLNVTNSFFKTATNALDVLRRAPGLTVSQDGAISVSGQYAPVVYIDGKQQPVTAEELANLQASDIEKVELITNASAQFDGEARAVINIKLKRDKTLGWKGSVYGALSRNQLYTGGEAGGSATYKTRRWVHYGRVGYAVTNNFITGLNKRVVHNDGRRTVFDNNQLISTAIRPLSYQFSSDYSPGKNHLLGVFVKGIVTGRTDVLTNPSDRTEYDATGNQTGYTLLQTNNTDKTHHGNVSVDLNYQGTLSDRGDQLSVFADYAYYNTAKTQDFRNDFLSGDGLAMQPALVLHGSFPTTIHIRSLRSDYVMPLNQTTKLELGVKVSKTSTDNELRYDTLGTEGLVYDPLRSNQFRYGETIGAAYGQFTKSLGNLEIEGGLRAENTWSQGNSLTLDSLINRRYLRVLPSLKVQYKAGETDLLSVSFSRKLERPSFYALNPFTLYLDPYQYMEGNPFLLPVTHNTLNLAYTRNAFTFTVNHVLDKDVIAQQPVQDDQTKVIRYTRVNLDRQRRYWSDVTGTHELTKWWKMQYYTSLEYLQTRSAYVGGGQIDTKAWIWSFNGSQVFNLSDAYSLEVSYNYTSPGMVGIYRTYGNGMVSLGFQKTLWHGRGNLQVNLKDLFNTYREYFTSDYQNLDISIFQKRNSRQANVRLTYNFGQSTFSRKNRASGSAEEESRAK